MHTSRAAPWRRALAQQASHDLHRLVDVAEERLVARTEVVQPRLAVRRLDEAVLGTPPVAGEADVARPAVVGQGVELGLAEGALLR